MQVNEQAIAGQNIPNLVVGSKTFISKEWKPATNEMQRIDRVNNPAPTEVELVVYVDKVFNYGGLPELTRLQLLGLTQLWIPDVFQAQMTNANQGTQITLNGAVGNVANTVALVRQIWVNLGAGTPINEAIRQIWYLNNNAQVWNQDRIHMRNMP